MTLKSRIVFDVVVIIVCLVLLATCDRGEVQPNGCYWGGTRVGNLCMTGKLLEYAHPTPTLVEVTQ